MKRRSIGKPLLCDQWESLRIFFLSRGDGYPEIHVVNMSGAGRRACIGYLVQRSVGCVPHFEVPLAGYEALLEAGVTQPQGVLMLLIPAMPPLVVDLFDPNRLTLSYATDHNWSYVSAVAWLNTLFDLLLLAPGAALMPDRRYFTSADAALLRFLLGLLNGAV